MASELPSTLTKRTIRWGEWLAETAIKVVAGTSVLLILLIFIFVFREAAGLFSGKTIESENARHTTSATSDNKPEEYNPDAGADSTSTAPSEESTSPDVYNPEIEEIISPSESTTSAPVEIPAEKRTIWENLMSNVWQPVGENPKFGMQSLFIGTAKATFIAVLISAPLGILAAVYSAFFAKKWLREIIKPTVEILAGFPSVVVGFFCLMIVASLMQSLFGTEYRLNALVGGFGLAVAIIPIIFTITDDALTSVPKSYREASLALGASEWETAFKVMLPAALPGVFAAVLLGVGRAFGETMIALMATGNAAIVSASFTEPVRTLAATIGAEMGEVIWGSLHYNILFFLGIVLFIISFCINLVTELYVKKKLTKKFQGG
ncbi:MAG: phosphate ABC transporter permease subunit PstC [Ignavibacteria bacterium]|nr:phosphate ABC transporter permease subunit PstC [Ignavibacteria bacterium]